MSFARIFLCRQPLFVPRPAILPKLREIARPIVSSAARTIPQLAIRRTGSRVTLKLSRRETFVRALFFPLSLFLSVFGENYYSRTNVDYNVDHGQKLIFIWSLDMKSA